MQWYNKVVITLGFGPPSRHLGVLDSFNQRRSYSLRTLDVEAREALPPPPLPLLFVFCSTFDTQENLEK